jgi:hypothetical protein
VLVWGRVACPDSRCEFNIEGEMAESVVLGRKEVELDPRGERGPLCPLLPFARDTIRVLMDVSIGVATGLLPFVQWGSASSESAALALLVAAFKELSGDTVPLS